LHCRHFGADWTNPVYYDLTVNTGTLGTAGAVTVVEAAFALWKDIPKGLSETAER